MKEYKVFSNWDMSGLGTILTPAGGSTDTPIGKAHVRQFIKDAAGTSVDAMLICPTILRCPLWNSAARPYWDLPVSDIEEPEFTECTTSQRTMKRVREYIKAGGDPLKETCEAVREYGMDLFFSLRMNDWHHLNELTPGNHDRYPTVDLFCKQHPEYMIGDRCEHNPVGWQKMHPFMQDYMHKEVRAHYLALIDELLSLYPIDGLELDFMRCCNYFRESDLEEGTRVMTEFIVQVRARLDSEGRDIPLCLRMPARFDDCLKIGFDLETLAKKRVIQYVTISSSYIESLNLEIERYREKLPGVKIFGEIQAVVSNGLKDGWGVERRMTEEMYFAAANSLWVRGADGITLFNYQFLRRHLLSGWKEPQLPDIGKNVLEHLADRNFLRKCGKHYFVSGAKDVGWDHVLPASGTFTFKMKIFEAPADYRSAKLRLVSKSGTLLCSAALNGISLTRCESGELFSPFVTEGLPEKSEAVSFDIDVKTLRETNEISVNAEGDVFLAELALYPQEKAADEKHICQRNTAGQ